jgi:tRNA threonylcarbamoyladenosine biosynthesis protein TsaB
MITLAIDTSTPQGSVALLDGDVLLFDESFSSDRSHSASLFVTLEKVRAQIDHLDQIAVGLGPGSYAGVRISIAAALGLRLGLGAKLVGLPSVAALDTSAATYVAIGDARRDSFYFSRIESGVCVEGPLLATAAELAQHLEATANLPVFATAEVPQFPLARITLPSAAILARLAAAQRGITATDDLEPIYLREPHITQPKARPGIPRVNSSGH